MRTDNDWLILSTKLRDIGEYIHHMILMVPSSRSDGWEEKHEMRSQKISRISRIERLQRGQDPRFTHISLEQTLQNVCPQGMKAAPLLLSMHTQHTQSPSTPLSLLLFFLQSTPSVSSINLIKDLTSVVGPTFSSRELRSAANAIAKFITAGAGAWFTVVTTSTCSMCCWSSCSWRASMMVKVEEVGLHVAPQQPIPLNPSRCFRLVHLLLWFPPSIPLFPENPLVSCSFEFFPSLVSADSPNFDDS